jgi:hypothetical protein
VKRLAGILIISVYMLSFAEVHNLLQIPILVQHFKEHKKEDPSINFWAFIKLHYEGPIVVDDDYDRDRQLPFQSTDCCTVISVAGICECPQLSHMEIIVPVESPRQFSPYKEANKPHFTPIAVFQPPRFV